MWWLAADAPTPTDGIGSTAAVIGAIAACLVPVCGLIGILWSKREPKTAPTQTPVEANEVVQLLRERAAVNAANIASQGDEIDDLKDSVNLIDRTQSRMVRDLDDVVRYLNSTHDGWRR